VAECNHSSSFRECPLPVTVDEHADQDVDVYGLCANSGQLRQGVGAARATLKVEAISDPGAGQKGYNSLKLTCKPHS